MEDCSAKEPSERLQARATTLRAATLSGLATLQEMATHTGWLQFLAELRELAAVPDEEGPASGPLL